MTTTETNPIDEARLEAFVGQAVVDMGAAISGLLLHIGDRLGLYKAMAGAGPITSATLAPAPAPPSGTSASGSATRPPAATSSTTRPTAPTSCRPSRPWWSPTRTARSSSAARSRPSRPATPTTTVRRRVPHRRRGRLARARRPAVLRRAAAVPPRLRRPPGRARGCPHWTGWWTSCGPGRAWPTSAAGSVRPRSSWRRRSSAPRSSASTSTRPRSRPRARPRPRPAWHQRARFDVASAQGVPRHRLRPGVHVRLPCTTWATRSGPPGRIRQALAPDGTLLLVEPMRRRRARGEPEPGRADLLRPVHGDLHAGVAGPGGRPRARRAGRRAAAGGAAARGGLQPACAARPRPRSTSSWRPGHRRSHPSRPVRLAPGPFGPADELRASGPTGSGTRRPTGRRPPGPARPGRRRARRPGPRRGRRWRRRSGCPPSARRARRIRSAASGCPVRTAASAHSAAYQGRHMPLYQSRNCSGGVLSSSHRRLPARPRCSSSRASKNSPKWMLGQRPARRGQRVHDVQPRRPGRRRPRAGRARSPRRRRRG